LRCGCRQCSWHTPCPRRRRRIGRRGRPCSWARRRAAPRARGGSWCSSAPPRATCFPRCSPCTRSCHLRRRRSPRCSWSKPLRRRSRSIAPRRTARTAPSGPDRIGRRGRTRTRHWCCRTGNLRCICRPGTGRCHCRLTVLAGSAWMGAPAGMRSPTKARRRRNEIPAEAAAAAAGNAETRASKTCVYLSKIAI